MSNLVKDCIYITKPQKEFLKKNSEKLGIKSSELLRRILDKYIKEEVESDEIKYNNQRLPTKGKK